MARVRTVYFFRGPKYVRYDIDQNTGAESVDHAFYPRTISEAWTAMPSSFATGPHPIHAVVNWPDGFVYFFQGSKYVRWDATNDTVDQSFYPQDTAGQWPQLPASFAAGMNAAINWGDGRAFFFKDSKYVRYDIAEDRVDHSIYPRDIADGWVDFPASFKQGIDAAVNWGNGVAYFFKGPSYLSYDIVHSKVIEGPVAITEPGKWPELVAAGFTEGIDEIIEWPQADVHSQQIPNNLVPCRKQSLPTVTCGGSFGMNAVFAEANPSIPACGEYRQFVRGTVTVNGFPVRYITQQFGAAQPVVVRPRPGPGSSDDNFVEDGQPASHPSNRFGVDLHYGRRDASIGNGNLNDMYVPFRRSGAQYIGRDIPQFTGPAGTFVTMDLDFRGQLIDVCDGGRVLMTNQWKVTCSVP